MGQRINATNLKKVIGSHSSDYQEAIKYSTEVSQQTYCKPDVTLNKDVLQSIVEEKDPHPSPP